MSSLTACILNLSILYYRSLYRTKSLLFNKERRDKPAATMTSWDVCSFTTVIQMHEDEMKALKEKANKEFTPGDAAKGANLFKVREH